MIAALVNHGIGGIGRDGEGDAAGGGPVVDDAGGKSARAAKTGVCFDPERVESNVAELENVGYPALQREAGVALTVDGVIDIVAAGDREILGVNRGFWGEC